MIAAALSAVAVAVYLYAVRLYRDRFVQRRFPAFRIVCFIVGAAAFAAALTPPIDAYADRSFAWHMLQHVIMVFIATPLVLLGAPLLLAVSVTPPAVARRITGFAHSAPGRALFAPITGWLVFVFVLWGVHFSPLYEAALEHPPVHVLEHALFTFGAFLFWSPLIQIGYAPRPVSYALRMLYLFVAIPQGAFVAFAIGASSHVLYPFYTGVVGSADAALSDQRSGADLMWIAGGFLLFVAFMLEAGAWAANERVRAA